MKISMTLSEVSGQTYDELRRLEKKLIELSKDEKQILAYSSAHDDKGNIFTPNHWTLRDYKDALRFDNFAEEVAFALGRGRLAGEDARNWLLDEVKDYLLEHRSMHEYIGEQENTFWPGKIPGKRPPKKSLVTTTFDMYDPYQAVASYIGHLANRVRREREAGGTHHQETETGEADRGTERREPADTFELVQKDYTRIKYNGDPVNLNLSAAQILKYLSENCREQDVEPRKARKALTLQPESWRDLFRHTGLWDTLIVKGKKARTRRLSVYP